MEDLSEKVLNLADMIDYQEGSVVSREIVRKKGGTVTLFAFGRGQGLSEHTTPFDALVHVICGEANISISGEWRKVKAGEALIMPANKPHAVEARHSEFKMLLVMIKSE